MGVLTKLPVENKVCDNRPLEVFSYPSKTTFVEGEGAGPIEILLNAGSPLVAGDPLATNINIENNGCQDALVTGTQHYIESGQCDDCLEDVMVTKSVEFVIPAGYSLDLPGHYSSVTVTLGEEDPAGVFAPAAVPAGAKDQVVRLTSCFMDTCCGTPVVPEG